MYRKKVEVLEECFVKFPKGKSMPLFLKVQKVQPFNYSNSFKRVQLFLIVLNETFETILNENKTP